jgi:hypothetical protein
MQKGARLKLSTIRGALQAGAANCSDVPIPDPEQVQQNAPEKGPPDLLNDLIGNGEQVQRQFDA